MTQKTTAYLEHIAFRVRDIAWHQRFFGELFGLTVRDVDGDPDNPAQVWLTGGLQLVADPDFVAPEGRFHHLGFMAENADEAIARAKTLGATEHEKGPNWVSLPDGVVVEILQANGDAVAQALAVNPR
ncbi:MAG: VOC family protein [Rhodospirillales bacterium]|nr:VOC family protein [Rhodospirillales bacterium]